MRSNVCPARVQVAAAIIGKVGSGRVGIRFGPYNSFNGLAASYPGDDQFYAQVRRWANKTL